MNVIEAPKGATQMELPNGRIVMMVSYAPDDKIAMSIEELKSLQSHWYEIEKILKAVQERKAKVGA